MTPVEFINHIFKSAHGQGQRVGQFLFNSLPEPASEVVRGTLIDPFQKDFDANELTEWVESHLIFSDGTIIGVFNGNELLWEASEKKVSRFP